MADTGGVIQWLRLKLHPGSVKQLQSDAETAGKSVAQALLRELENGTHQEQAVAKYIDGIRRTFDKKVGELQKRVADGLGHPMSAQAAADKLVNAFNDRLQKGISRVGKSIDPAIQQQLVNAFSSPQLTLAQMPKETLGKFLAADIDKAKDEMGRVIPWFKQKFQDLKKDWTNIYRIPEAPDTTFKLEQKFKKQAAGDREEFNRLVQSYKLGSQAAQASLTPLGQILQALGVNTRSYSGAMKGLLTNLYTVNGQTGSLNTLNKNSILTWAGLKAALGPVAASLGLVISGYKLLKFAMDSVNEAKETEASWARVAVTLADYGKSLSTVTPELKQLVQENLKLGYTERQTAEIYGTLVQLTGDYKKSLVAVPTVIDLMVSRHMTLEMASKSLARAIVGSNESLQRQGIYLDENKDALEQLSQRYGGEAAARANAFAGSVDRISAAWGQFKKAIGEALIQGAGGISFFDTIAEIIRDATNWIRENAAAIQAFGLAFRVVFMALYTLVNGFFTGIKVGLVIIEGFIGLLRTLPSVGKYVWAEFVLETASAFQAIAKIIDFVFRTKLQDAFKQVIQDAQKFKREARNQLEQKQQENRDVVAETWNGTSVDKGGNPLAADAPITTAADHPRAMFHQRINKEVLKLRSAGLVDDEEKSNQALGELQQKLAEMKQASEETKDNRKEQLEYEKHIHDIEAAIAAIEKKRNKEAEKRREEAKLTHDIEANNQLLLSKDAAAKEMAGKNLEKIEAALLDKQRKQKLTVDERVALERHLQEIQEGKDRVQAQLQKTEDDEIRRLTQMVKLNVNREQAQARLNELMAYYTTELQQAQAKGDVDAAGRAAQRIADIEVAQRVELESTKERIQALTNELGVAELRKKATQDLLTLQSQLEKKMTNPKTLDRDKAELAQLIKQIQDAVGQPFNVRDLSRQSAALIELTKHGRTAAEALEGLNVMEERLKNILATVPLTPEEEAIVKAMLDKIRQIILHHPTKMGLEDFKDQWKDFVKEMPDMFRAATGEMTTVFSTAFQGMIRDARNLNHALSSIPKGAAAALAGELKKKATLRAEEDFAEALSHTGRGIADLVTPGMQGMAAGEFASAAQFAAAGAAWAALAGVAGSMQKSASTAYSNATDYAGGKSGGGSADTANGGRGDIYLFIDGVDPKNPNHQRLVGDTMREYRERYGGNIIVNGQGR